jgi:uncharacterized protein (UPF0216 family)
VRIEGDEMFQVTSHAGGSNSFRVASLTEAEENSTSFARHRDDVVDLLREISKATAHDSDHVIVMLRVAPIAPVKSSGTQILKGIAQLMKPLGCLCLALLGSADAAKCTKKELAAVRHSTRVLGSVLAAILRQWNRNSSSEDGGPSTGGNRHLSSVPLYVPFRDDGLTQALEPLLADGPAIAFLWLHLDGAALRPSSSELLQAADVVSNARFPNGRPPINFALLARQEHAVVVRLRQELATCRQAWDTERALLESDRLMLRKAYEAASHSTASSPPAQISAVFGNADEQQPTKSLRDTLQMTKLMLATAQREKVELERELTELRAQQAAPQRPNAMPSAEVSFVVSAAEVLVKEGIVERGTGETAHTALLQLVQQLAEREKVLFHMHPENDLSRKLLPPARWAEVLSRLKSSDGVSRMVGPSLGSDSPAAKGRKRSNTLL